MPSWCANISVTSLRRKKPRKQTSLPRLRARSLRPGRVSQRRQRLLRLQRNPGQAPRRHPQRSPEPYRQVRRQRRERHDPFRHRPQRRLSAFALPLRTRPALHPPRRNPEQFRPRHRHHLLRLRDLLEQHLRHRHPGLAYRCVPLHLARYPEHPWEHVPRLRHPVRRVLPVLQRPAKDFRFVREPLRGRAKAGLARRKACVPAVHHNNIDQAARPKAVREVLRVNVPAGLLRAFRNAPGVARVVAIIKLRWAVSVPAQEYRKPNRASLCMRASPPHAAGRSSRSVTRKASASCIQFVREQELAPAVAQQRSNRSRR